MSSKIKLAVLLYGQPRFLEETSKSIQQEFEIEGVETDYFYHAWSEVGYGLEEQTGKKNDVLDADELKEKYHSIYNPACGSVSENDDELRDIIKNIFNLSNYISKHKEINKLPCIEMGIYRCGQLYSIGQAFQSLSSYQKENNIEYDVIVSARTDCFHLGPEFYESEEEYDKKKYQFYIDTVMKDDSSLFCTDGLVYFRGDYFSSLWNWRAFDCEMDTYLTLRSLEHLENGQILLTTTKKEEVIINNFDYFDTVECSSFLEIHSSYKAAKEYYPNLMLSYISTLADEINRTCKNKKTKVSNGGHFTINPICGRTAIYNKINLKNQQAISGFRPTFKVVNSRSLMCFAKSNPSWGRFVSVGEHEEMIEQALAYQSRQD